MAGALEKLLSWDEWAGTLEEGAHDSLDDAKIAYQQYVRNWHDEAPMGMITKGECGSMCYQLQIFGEGKPRRVYWRNHRRSYIKNAGEWIQVYFNQYLLDRGQPAIPMFFSADGEWKMNYSTEQLNALLDG